jgi:hypothetical protein
MVAGAMLQKLSRADGPGGVALQGLAPARGRSSKVAPDMPATLRGRKCGIS